MLLAKLDGLPESFRILVSYCAQLPTKLQAPTDPVNPVYRRTIYLEPTKVRDLERGEVIGGLLLGHTCCVQSISFSPDGVLMASAAGDGVIKIWDAASGEVIGEPLNTYLDDIESVSFSRNNNLLVSESLYGTFRVWDVVMGTSRNPLWSQRTLVHWISFSSDGKPVGSDSVNVIPRPPPRVPTSLSPDGRHVACSGHDDSTARLWDVESGAAIGRLFCGATGKATSVSFSLDGKCIVSSSGYGAIRIWDTESRRMIGEPSLRHWLGSMCVVFLGWKTYRFGFFQECSSVGRGIRQGYKRSWRHCQPCVPLVLSEQ